MKKATGIRTKLTKLILSIVVVAVLICTCVSGLLMINMRSQSLETTINDAVERLNEMANSKATMADSMLRTAQNQTLLVKEGAEKILANSDSYLLGYSEDNLPDLICASEERKFVTVAAPADLLTDIVKNENDVVVSAKLNTNASLSGKYTINQQRFFGSFLDNELSQIYRFRTEGTEEDYKGFAASMFCFDDSGITIFGDPKTSNHLIQYDARTTAWYKGAVEAANNGTLTNAGVYWAGPFLDAAGRGSSLNCSSPVYVNGKIIGVVGSGGLINDFAELVESSTIGESGYSFMVSRNTSTVVINPRANSNENQDSEVAIGKLLSESKNSALVELNNTIKNGGSGQLENITIDGNECYLAYSALSNNDWTMVTIISRNDNMIMESYEKLNVSINTAFVIFFMLVAVMFLIAVLTSNRFAKRFTMPIIELKKGVDEIGSGNLDYELDIKTGDEVEELGNSFNEMATNLENYIENLASVTAEKERIGAELDVAKNIQASMLPCIFPAFPEKNELDIYATMTPAKEVGGDFYDFFMIDEKHIAIVMADVSGKGVPAALFMVIGKTLIKDHTQLNKNLSDVFTEVNDLLCEANSEGLFITAFEGVLNLETGEFNFVNAGHEMPFIYRKSEDKYEAYKIKPGFVLAGMEGMRYKAGSVTLDVGDKVFQYTDGVTEATDKDNGLYGMQRLEAVLNTCQNDTPQVTLEKVREDIDKFVGDAPQFDDITMLCLEYKEKYKSNNN